MFIHPPALFNHAYPPYLSDHFIQIYLRSWSRGLNEASSSPRILHDLALILDLPHRSNSCLPSSPSSFDFRSKFIETCRSLFIRILEFIEESYIDFLKGNRIRLFIFHCYWQKNVLGYYSSLSLSLSILNIIARSLTIH